MGNPIVPTASRTWTILLALAAQLATITRANGYLTDVGLNVWTTDSQRPDDAALGLVVLSENITGTPLDQQRPGKPVREFAMLVEAAIGTELDDAQQQIHSIIEDIENCMAQYARQQQRAPADQVTPMAVTDIAIMDHPEGMAVIAASVRIAARFLR